MKKLFVFAIAALVSVMSHAGIALNPDVTQDTVAKTICVPGYTSGVRPAVSYTNGIKKKLLTAAGISLDQMSAYELDHIVPLSIGGHPRSLENLQLQVWDGTDGARIKDILEVRLNKLVCRHQLPLAEAQECIYQNWQACAARYPK